MALFSKSELIYSRWTLFCTELLIPESTSLEDARNPGGVTHGTEPGPSSLPVNATFFNVASRKSLFYTLWFYLHRTWRTNLPKGACALLLTSVDHDRAPVAGVRVNVLLSRYLIEPCGSGKSKLTYMCRADLRYVWLWLLDTVRAREEELDLFDAKEWIDWSCHSIVVTSWSNTLLFAGFWGTTS